MNKRIRKKQGIAKIHESECWNLDMTIIKFILPRLKRYNEINMIAYPKKYSSTEEWHMIVEKIIWSFQFALDVVSYNYSLEYRNDKENWDRYNEGMDLFKDNLMDLWY